MSSIGWATTYYVVATSGNDANAGTSTGAAWKTIQKAANAMGAGDTAAVLAGSYNERVQPVNSGTPDAPITFKAQGKVVIQGFTLLMGCIHIDGFEIISTPNDWKDGAGVYLEGDGYEVLNNYIHHTSREDIRVSKGTSYANNAIIRGNTIAYADYNAVTLFGKNNLVENNDISHTINTVTTSGDADVIRAFGDGYIIRSNYIHDLILAEMNLSSSTSTPLRSGLQGK